MQKTRAWEVSAQRPVQREIWMLPQKHLNQPNLHGWQESLLAHLAPAIGKIFGRIIAGNPGADLADRATTFVVDKWRQWKHEPGQEEIRAIINGLTNDPLEERQLIGLLDQLASNVAYNLAPLFVHERTSSVNAEAVMLQVRGTLNVVISNRLLFEGDFEASHIETALRKVPLPRGQFSDAERQLYTSAIKQISRLIVKVALSLESIRLESVRVLLRRQSQILRQQELEIATISEIETSVAKLVRGDDRAFETEYRYLISEKLDYLELLGLEIPAMLQRYRLNVAYVSLSIAKTGTYQPVKQLFDSLKPGNSRVLIYADAGGGKTTLLRWAALSAARVGKSTLQAVNADADQEEELKEVRYPELKEVRYPSSSQTTNWRLRVPFLIALRECKEGRLPPLSSMPLMTTNVFGDPPVGWVERILEAGRGLLLLDGVDELPPSHIGEVCSEIRGLAERWNRDNYIIVTARPSMRSHVDLVGADFREAEISPLSDLDRTLLIRQWHEALELLLREQGRDREANETTAIAARLNEQIEAAPSLSQLARNPLLSAAVCALNQRTGRNLPRSQAELCESLCRILLMRDEDRGFAQALEPAFQRLSYGDRRDLVQRIAVKMLFNGWPEMPIEKTVDLCAELLQHMGSGKDADARQVVRGLVARGGIIRERRSGWIEFIHNSLKEYLVGDALARGGDQGVIVSNVHQDSWRNVAVFASSAGAAASLTDHGFFADELLRELLDRLSNERSGKVLVLKCRAAARYVSEDINERVNKIVKELTPPRTMDEAVALAEAGDAVVPFLKYRKDMDEDFASACVRTLRLVRTETSQRALLDYLDDVRSGVVEELAQAMDPLRIRWVLEMVYAGKPLPEGIASQVHDLSGITEPMRVEWLDLRGTKVENLLPVKAMERLRVLVLRGTPVEDLSPLKKMQKLEHIDIISTRVKDVSPLYGLISLKFVVAAGQVSNDNIGPLRNKHDLAIS